nr:hypothetical protein [uncultured Flavobacterium sp.]
MTDEFIPPIKERTTKQLIEIIREPENWNPRAVLLAKHELDNRNVSKEEIDQKIKQKRYLIHKEQKIENFRKSKEYYHWSDFIIAPVDTLMDVLLSWNLEKQGYTKKAEQQKTILRILAIIVLCIVILYYFYTLLFQSER